MSDRFPVHARTQYGSRRRRGDGPARAKPARYSLFSLIGCSVEPMSVAVLAQDFGREIGLEHMGDAFFQDSQTVCKPVVLREFLEPARWFVDVLERELERPVVHWHQPM